MYSIKYILFPLTIWYVVYCYRKECRPSLLESTVQSINQDVFAMKNIACHDCCWANCVIYTPFYRKVVQNFDFLKNKRITNSLGTFLKGILCLIDLILSFANQICLYISGTRSVELSRLNPPPWHLVYQFLKWCKISIHM